MTTSYRKVAHAAPAHVESRASQFRPHTHTLMLLRSYIHVVCVCVHIAYACVRMLVCMLVCICVRMCVCLQQTRHSRISSLWLPNSDHISIQASRASQFRPPAPTAHACIGLAVGLPTCPPPLYCTLLLRLVVQRGETQDSAPLGSRA